MRRSGFTLVEVLVATVILATGLLALLTAMTQAQKQMMASERYETAHYVLALGETLHPLLPSDRVTGDPESDDNLNVKEERGDEIADHLDIDLSRDRKEELSQYRYRREVEEPEDDEALDRIGKIYVVRTTISWGGRFHRDSEESISVVQLWRKD